MLPPNVVSSEGNELVQNRLQQWLWSAWNDVMFGELPRLIGDDEWVLVVNGDAIEGNHHGTKELVSHDESDHVEIAAELLRPLAEKATQTFLVEGTECHTKNHEHALGRLVNATPDPETGRCAWSCLHLRVAGQHVLAHHHIGTTSRTWLESGEPGRALVNARAEALAVGAPVPDVVIASHRHRWSIVQGPHGTAVVTPAWQGVTRYGRKVVPAARLQVGAMVLDWRNVSDGTPPHVHRLIRSTARSR